MPEGWLEDEEAVIPDPSAARPDDWDDEEDGEWEPTMVSLRNESPKPSLK